MQKNTSNSQLKVDGKMTSKGADRVGLLQGIALLVLSVSTLGLSVAAILYSLK